jgi:hypothetical protein
VIVSFDEKNPIHFICVPLLRLRGEDWIALDGVRTLDKKIEQHTWLVDCRHLEVVLVVDPKSKAEKAGKVVESLLQKAYVKLTLMFGRRIGEEAEVKKK